MGYKLIATTLLASSLFAAPVIAYAQSDTYQKGQSTSSESKYEGKTSMKHHKMQHAHMKPGTTTGMSTHSKKPTTKKPPAS